MRPIPSTIRPLPALIALALSAASSVALAAAVDEDGWQPVQPATTAGATRDPGWVEAHEDATQPVEPPVVDRGPPPGTQRGTDDRRQSPAPPVLEFQTLEDQPLTLDLPPGFDGLDVIEPPAHGTLLTNQKPMQYVPHPDFSGLDVISFGTSKPEATLSIKVTAVNDPPTFDSTAGVAHAAGDAGVHDVSHWATSIDAGPGAEAWTQQVWFDATETDDPAGVVESLAVAPDGTLGYVLSGRPGIATWTVRALDNGGDQFGGSSVSETRLVRIGVDASADLAIKIVPLDAGPRLRLHRSYQLVVSNLGKSDAFAARVVDVLPKDAGNPIWRCVGHAGGACPKVAAGSGAVDTTIDLPSGSLVVFTVDRMAAPAGDPSHVAYVVPPDYLVDPDLSNNEASE